jgi:hypothetical protein
VTKERTRSEAFGDQSGQRSASGPKSLHRHACALPSSFPRERREEAVTPRDILSFTVMLGVGLFFS